MDRDNEMINRYLSRINDAINNGNDLPDYIMSDLINIKNKLENINTSIDARKLLCVLADDIFYRIKLLGESKSFRRRR